MSQVMLNQDQHKRIAMHIIYILEQRIIRNIKKKTILASIHLDMCKNSTVQALFNFLNYHIVISKLTRLSKHTAEYFCPRILT
jgi:hypothetical protein